jgi:tagaturonate reductase
MSAPTLNRSGVAPLPIRILQIGDGVFLRGFVDWMVDVANKMGVASLGVAIATARPHKGPPALAAQDNLFTVIVRGAGVDERRIVTAAQASFDPHAEPARLRALAASPDLRFVVSNTTEAGIVDVPETYDPAASPSSFPAKVAWLLKARFDALGSDAQGLIFLPCELIEANGATLKRFALAHAERWGFTPDFIAWVERRSLFLDTLVDRIVPGFPATEAEALFAEWGYRDPLAVMAESFHLWVIEGPKEIAEEWPLAQAGLNVIWTDNLKPYRDRKVRMLNGAHTALALPAFLAGLDTVGEAIGDPLFSRYLDALMFAEIAPWVDLPAAERESYGRTTLERFANPFLRHELIAIAMNSVSKWKARLLPTVKDAVAATGRAPRLIAYGFAALLWFYRGQADRGVYPLRDDPQALTLFAEAWREAPRDAALRLMRDIRLWGEDLTAIPTFADEVVTAIEDIASLGLRAALAGRLSL